MTRDWLHEERMGNKGFMTRDWLHEERMGNKGRMTSGVIDLQQFRTNHLILCGEGWYACIPTPGTTWVGSPGGRGSQV